MPIRVLDPEVAQKIAAGEVVERPASAVKELVENALDASARQVQIEIRSGGLGLIRVVDDGCGIPAAEAELAFARHATSKLRAAEDLVAIQTLGFRGEALASIAAISQIILYTRHADDDLGVTLALEAGQLVERKPWAGAVGTTLLVKNLFFNVPARLKFLRTATGEAGQIGHLIEQFALGHPDVRFRFVNEGRRVLETPGSGDLRDAARQIYGPAVADSLLAIDETSELARVRVWGLIGLPDQTRASRAALSFFVNGRRIANASLGYALEEAYRPALPPGRHPIVALHLALPPTEVDCNVHPTKAEVRLVNDRQILGAVHRAVRTALLEVAPIPEVGASLAPAAWTAGEEWPLVSDAETRRRGDAEEDALTLTLSQRERGSEASSQSRREVDGHVLAPSQPDGASPSEVTLIPSPATLERGRGGEAFAAIPDAPSGSPSGGELAPRPPISASGGADVVGRLRPIGQVQNTYIVAEGPGGVYFIDQHTAHERILYEEILAQRSGPDAPSQALLAPVVVALSAQQRAALAERGCHLTQLGFAVEEFGPDAFVVRAVPPRLVRADLARALRDAADALAGEPVGPDGADRLAATLACHSAVRAGDALTRDEIAVLLARLEQTDVNRYCPHGRPIVVHLSAAQLERDFHRR